MSRQRAGQETLFLIPFPETSKKFELIVALPLVGKKTNITLTAWEKTWLLLNRIVFYLIAPVAEGSFLLNACLLLFCLGVKFQKKPTQYTTQQEIRLRSSSNNFYLSIDARPDWFHHRKLIIKHIKQLVNNREGSMKLTNETTMFHVNKHHINVQ